MACGRPPAIHSRTSPPQQHEFYDGHPSCSYWKVRALSRRALNSGYYVAPPLPAEKRPSKQLFSHENVDINTYIFDVLQASCRPAVVPFGSAFPDPRLFPLAQLNRSLAGVGRYTSAVSITENLPRKRGPAIRHCPALCATRYSCLAG